jgi:hypothetical protein
MLATATTTATTTATATATTTAALTLHEGRALDIELFASFELHRIHHADLVLLVEAYLDLIFHYQARSCGG